MNLECWNWKAVQDNTPGPDEHGTLTIAGICGKFPTDGYQLKLMGRRGGINPWEPFFDLVVGTPSDVVPKVLSDEPVDHTMPVDRQSRYTKVTIYFEDEPRWSIDVDQVS